MYKMDFYFTDRQYNMLGIASTERGQFRMAGEIEAQSTTASTVALTGNIYFAKGDLDDAIAMVVGDGGNYILYQDDRGIGHFMTIQNTQVDNTGCSINFQADDAGDDLKNEIVGEYAANKAMTFAQYFSTFCADSGWEIGLNEIPANTRTLEFTSEQSSYDRMLEVANDFGVSLYYTFTIEGMTVTNRYLNVVNELGSTTGITLRQGTDISQIVSETSTANLHTSIKAYGATPDGASHPINLAGYKWTDSTGQFALGSDGVLRDTIAIRTWSRLRSNTNPTPESSHLQMVKTYESTTQATLLQSALADLKQYNHPAVNYTVAMVRVPSELSKGDVVNVEDEAQNLYLSATVLEVDKCYSMPSSSTLTLGDFKIEHDQTSAQIKQAAKSAEDAVSKATTAFSYAATVDEKADNAQTIATDAATTAENAKDTAAAAQTMANTAQTTANTAQDTATTAAQSANTAQTLAKANRTFIKSADEPDTTDLPVNAVWLQPATTDADGNTVAASAKTWSGAAWQDTHIESSLIAQNIIGKNITGSTFGNANGTFSIDENGNIAGGVITGSTFNTATTDNSYMTQQGKMTPNGLGFTTTYKNVTGSDVQLEEASVDWAGPRLKTTYADGTSETAGLGTTGYAGANVYAWSQAANGDITGEIYLSGNGLTILHNSQFVTLTNDQLVQMSNSGKVLWSGALYPNASTVIQPSTPINDCLNGWVLVWSGFTDGAAQDYNFNFTFIPKAYVNAFSGKGVSAVLTNQTALIASKYVYVTNTDITGNDNNRNAYVLRQVIAW
ncbi:phage tail spike protein [Lacticaseibacillus mingshuiensis]|uniref:phage tail spike protein n=1 Tax=Lacticaseibacillus mingshuiensis TaxID=2799574 RepID=UPI0019435C36|nr:phage tail spike protein [Lacticaseibacillus mingshuiensis]